MRPYLEAVESGHQWLGRLPVHWRISPLGAHFDERGETVSDENFPPLSVSKDGIVPQMVNVAKTDNGGNRKLVRAGDFAINSRSDRKGSAGLSALDGSTSVVYTVLAPRPSIDGRFVHHLLRSQAFQEEFYRWGNGIVADLWSTRYSSMKRIPLPVPPLPEQRAIAAYLDRETARIDSLIEEQQRLIELLFERRWAVVERSVALLDWDTPFKAAAVLIQTGPFGSQLKSEEYEEGGTPVINPSHIVGGEVFPDPRIAVGADKAKQLARHALEEGDVVVARRGELGRCAVVSSSAAGFLCGTGSALLRLNKAVVESSFVSLVFSSRRNRDALSLASVGSTMDNLNSDIIGSLRIPVPTRQKQRELVAQVSRAEATIDTLIGETKRFIQLARERRVSLITAAVTGQIDVREVA